MTIAITNVSKRFGRHTALDNVSLEVPAGELVALLGPSGSGKTTLLRVIAGLEAPDAGTIHLHGEDAGRRDVRQRNVGFVFQHYALFRHKTVFENIAFALRMRKRPRQEVRERVEELLALIQLQGLGQRYPPQLSGGQRQRVALARALAARPAVLLLDEPFGALDARVRQELRQWVRRLHEEIHVTSVFVTHDQEEAMELADRVVILNQGRIEQVGTPDEVYHHPANPFVMRFLGQVNLFHGRVEDGRFMLGGAALPAAGAGEDRPVVGYVRPHHLDISREANGKPAWPARVTRVHSAGYQVRVDLVLKEDNRRVEVALPFDRFRELQLKHGESVFVESTQIKVFRDGECAI
jgi:sulfate transport system ATP-binding protein